MSKRPLVYSLVCLAVLGLLIVPVGTAVFALGFGAGDSPCVMCWEERIGMVHHRAARPVRHPVRPEAAVCRPVRPRRRVGHSS